MAYGRDIVIRLPDASITDEDVRQSLAKFVTVLSVTAAPGDPATLHARLLSPTHVDHLLNVLSGRLRVSGWMCAFARPSDGDSDDEDETLIEDLHSSYHDAFLTPPPKRKTSPTPIKLMEDSFADGFLTPPRRKTSPVPIAMLDQSSVFMTPPQSLSQSTLGDDSFGSPGRSPQQLTTIPIGLHPEITVLDPSPERPENRAPRRRAVELAAIFDSHDGGSFELQHQLLQLQKPEAQQQTKGCAFLPLPAPYHLLPNTPYFRNAPIAPPPLKPVVPPGPAQRTVNRYLASMKVMDNLAEMEIQSLICFNFNRTIGTCPFTIPEKTPLQLNVPADRDDDFIDEDWSIWSAANDHHELHQKNDVTCQQLTH